MKTALFTALLALGLQVNAQNLYPHFSQPHDGSGVLVPSAWWSPSGSDYDEYVWDSFAVPTTQSIKGIRWRGGRQPAGLGGAVVDFQIKIYPSVGDQPNIAAGPLQSYSTGDNAGQTLAGTFGTVTMYDYRYALPAPFVAYPGVTYWVQITASQHGTPDWGLATGARGNGKHVHLTRGTHIYVPSDSDFAVTLLTDDSTNSVTTSVSTGGGATHGDGSYSNGLQTAVVAVPDPGYVFINWKEGVTQVSTAATYSFTVDADRNLTATFAAGCSITTTSSPTGGGVTTGDGTYPVGSNVTLRTTANPGFRFVNWTLDGTSVSAATNYQVKASANRAFVANFAPVLEASPVSTEGLIVSWPAAADGYALFENMACLGTNWIPATNDVTVVSNRNRITISPSTDQRFFRLQKQ